MGTDSDRTDGASGQHHPGQPREVLLRVVATPAMTRSWEAFNAQAQDLVGLATRTLATQVASLRLSEAVQRKQQELVKDLAPAILSRQRLDEMLRPLAEEITAAQKRWAKTLAVPVMAQARLQAKIAGLVVTPELTAALDQINDLARVRMVFPDGDGLARLDTMIETGDLGPDTLAAAESGIAPDAELSNAIDAAAAAIAVARPWIPRERARQLVVFWVWAMWSAALFAVYTTAPAEVVTALGAMGAPAANTVAGKAKQQFDQRYPADDEPDDTPD